MGKHLELWEVDGDVRSKLTNIAIEATVTEPPPEPPPPADPDIIAVMALFNLNVRNMPSQGGALISSIKVNTAFFVEDEIFITDSDPYQWRRIWKLNGDNLKGMYVAERLKDGTGALLSLKETEPVPPKVWGSKRVLVGSQTVPVFTKNGQVHPIYMVNMRPLPYLGKNIAPFQYSTMHFVNFTLDRCKANNARNCVRFYFPLLGYTDQFMIDRVKEALDLLQGRFTAFITLMDCVDGRGGNAPHMFVEDAPFYSNGYIRKDYFTDKHYRERMLPAAEKLVKALKDRDVFAYGVANEPTAQYHGNATDKEQADCISFLHEVADMIHATDNRVLVTPGLLNIAHLHNGNGTMKALFDRVYGGGHFNFAGFNMYEKVGQAPFEMWEHEQLVRTHDLPYSRLNDIPLLNTEMWRNNNNPHGTAAVKAKFEQWGAFPVECSPWGAYFGPDHNATSKDVGWSSQFDDQWESSLIFLADDYTPKQNALYGVNW